MKQCSRDHQHTVRLTLNGAARSAACEPRMLLSDFLRHVVGAKHLDGLVGLVGERQKDALETFQLEIGRDAQYPVFNWFKEYLDKVSLNETFRTTQADSRGVANGGSQG